MFFAASKVVWFVLTPSNLLFGLALLGVVAAILNGRLARGALRLALGSLALLGILGFGPIGSWLLLPLESRFPKPGRDGPPVTGIVVLGGAVRADLSVVRDELNVGEAGERVVAMADLARRHPAARIVFSGGSGNLLESERPEAEAVLRYAGEVGLDPARITVENRSRTTWENAVESKALVGPKPGERWLLVTSAWHMPRAVGAFRQAGFPVVAYPVDYLTEGSRDLWRPQPRVGAGLDRVDGIAKEWVGLLAYRLSGRSDALLPGP